MEFFITALSTTASTLKIAESRSLIASKLRMIIKFLSQGKINVVVLGCGGIGKTTLGYILTNQPSKVSTEYNETRTIKYLKVGQELIGNYVIGPGQETRIEQYWPEIYGLINANKVNGLIYLCSYGYHSIADIESYKNTKYYRDGMTKSEFIQEYLASKRQEEIEVLNLLKTRIMDTKKKFWLCTLVTKQDLWWNKRREVRKHYTKGEYSKIINEISRTKGKQNFNHEYLSTSLLMNNFKIGNQVMKKTVAGYDEQIRLPHQIQLVNFVNDKNN